MPGAEACHLRAALLAAALCRLYVESQERAVMGELEAAQQQYRDRVAVLQSRQQETEDREVGGRGPCGVGLPAAAAAHSMLLGSFHPCPPCSLPCPAAGAAGCAGESWDHPAALRAGYALGSQHAPRRRRRPWRCRPARRHAVHRPAHHRPGAVAAALLDAHAGMGAGGKGRPGCIDALAKEPAGLLGIIAAAGSAEQRPTRHAPPAGAAARPGLHRRRRRKCRGGHGGGGGGGGPRHCRLQVSCPCLSLAWSL